eukprot:TCONS_00047402-protein
MSILASKGQLMDDLLFHELWLAKQKFKEYEDETTYDGEADFPDSTDDEDRDDFKQLFLKERRDKKHKRKEIIGNNTSEWMAVIIGVFFVAAVAGVASYHAYRSDLSDELGRASVTSISSDEALMSDAAPTYQLPEGFYDEIRLPTNLSPTNYVLYLSIDMAKKYYNGLVKITFDCVQQTDRIILHSSKTKNTKVEVKDGKEPISVLDTQYNLQREMMVITLGSNLTFGNVYTLLVSFERPLRYTDNDGFYLTDYVDSNSLKHMMANTDFEPSSARRAFPCFDEPAYKATFEIFAQHPKNDYFALSNMPVKQKIELGTDRTETHFSITPKMSTYLVGWVITSYENVQTTGPNNVKIRVFAPKGRLSETNFAEGMAPYCIQYFEDKIRINYTLPKMDLVPYSKMSAGADEVWGMIIFTESSLLYDSKIGNSNQLFRIATTVCHEISHMWFGDLVTMKWWNDLWLKESFAAYLEYLPVEKRFPDWDLPSKIYSDGTVSALSYDSSIYTHPIRTLEKDPKKMRQNYDAITYEKGAAVVSMLANYIGDDKFFEGVNSFLNKYKYGNADAHQFWRSMEKSVKTVDVVSLMNSWVNQAGYPVILMKAKKNRSGVEVSQERFVFQNKTVTNLTKDFDTKWEVPIAIQTSDDENITRSLLTDRKGSIEVNLTNSDWFIGNYKATGFYRTYYDKENWRALLKVLEDNHETLSVVDRASLLNDVAAFSNFNFMELASSLEFTTYLSQERHPIPWGIGLGHIYIIRGLFYETNLKKCFDAYIDKLISPVLEDLNKTPKHTHLQKLLITKLTSAAVTINKQPLTDEIVEKFLKYLVRDGNYHIPADLLLTVFSAGIKHGQAYEWDALMNRFKKAKSLMEQSLILNSLVATTDKKLLKRYLSYATNSSNIPSFMAQTVLRGLCAHHESHAMAWKYVQDNYLALDAENSAEPILTRYLLNSCMLGKTQQDLDEAEAFVKRYNLQKDIAVLRNIEAIKYSMELMKEKDSVEKWLKERHHLEC